MNFFEKILSYISKTQIYGILPLDIVFHFIIGAGLTIFFLKLTKSNLILSLLFVLVIEVIKEIYDSFTMTATLTEAIKDIVVTIIHPVLLIIIRKIRKKPLTGSQGYYQ